MKIKQTLSIVVVAAAFAVSASSLAAVSAEEAAQLKTNLTPMGAEKAGNKDGSIPAWSGGYTKVPAGYKSGQPRIDPFAGEKPLFSITAKNMDQYADKLTDGVKALMKKYPTYRIDVFPTHRTAAAPQWYYDNTYKNAVRGKTKDGGLGLEGSCGGVPFPIPKTGYEVMWNHLLAWKGESSQLRFRSLVMPTDGKMVIAGEATNDQNFPFNFKDACEGYNGLYWQLYQITQGPPFRTGESLIAVDAVDQVGRGRQAWQYLVGQRRVRRAPMVGYDTPDSVNSGTNYFDEAFVFNGGLDRFQWKLVGKKEVFIPYNNNGFTLATIENVMTPNHLNPDYLRWELHRVWVVEAELAPGKRNVVPKRRIYVDEDTWNGVLYDGWDAQGQLWRTGYGLVSNIFELPGSIVQTFGIYNLLGNTYNVVNAPNGFSTHYKLAPRFPESHFSPDAMGGSGVR